VAEVARVPCDVVYEVFGNELSMGKSMGLMGMVRKVQSETRKRAAG
jgi:cysteine desulfuration protein SufE